MSAAPSPGTVPPNAIAPPASPAVSPANSRRFIGCWNIATSSEQGSSSFHAIVGRSGARCQLGDEAKTRVLNTWRGFALGAMSPFPVRTRRR